jgi:molybdopterin-guanine dinucleotide biosynthesis protein A
MGTAKYELRLGSETLLQRICRIVQESADRVIVVAAPGQTISHLEAGVQVIRDDRPGDGPLAGIGRGLQYFRSEGAGDCISQAFVTACDVPLLKPGLIDFLFDQLSDHDAVVMQSEGRLHPLCGVYRTSVAPTATELLDAGQRRPLTLLQTVNTRTISADLARTVDPDLSSLVNVNTPEEFQALTALLNEDHRPS